ALTLTGSTINVSQQITTTNSSGGTGSMSLTATAAGPSASISQTAPVIVNGTLTLGVNNNTGVATLTNSGNNVATLAGTGNTGSTITFSNGATNPLALSSFASGQILNITAGGITTSNNSNTYGNVSITSTVSSGAAINFTNTFSVSGTSTLTLTPN